MDLSNEVRQLNEQGKTTIEGASLEELLPALKEAGADMENILIVGSEASWSIVRKDFWKYA
jgi:hypothetical protein